MFHFGTRKCHEWHEKINKTVKTAHRSPPFISGSPNPAFPWAQLRLHTDIYLKKKGDLRPEECDKRLLSLIQKHGAIQIAVAACAHQMSPKFLMSYIIDRLDLAHLKARGSEVVLSPNQVQFLGAIAIAHHVNSFTFTEADSQLAQALIRCSTSNLISSGQKLETIMKLLIKGILGQSPISPLARRMAHGYSTKLSVEVQLLKESSSWLKAHAETAWLSTLLVQPQLASQEQIEAMEILSARFPDWRIWAEWDELDSQLAQALDASRQPAPMHKSQLEWDLPISTPSPSQSLERLVRVQLAGIPRKNPFVYLDARERTRILSAELSLHVRTLMDSHEFLMAHNRTEWLSALLDEPLQSSVEVLEMKELLGAQFPDWRAWAEWRESDTQLAHALIPCSTRDSRTPSQKLKIVIDLLMSGVSGQSILYSEVHNLARTLSIELAQILHVLGLEGLWYKAREESLWLSLLLDKVFDLSTRHAEAVQEFKYGFADWRAWAVWRPDMQRLFLQKQLTAEQRHCLSDLLALEGPDFDHSHHSTKRESLIAQYPYPSCTVLEVCLGRISVNVTDFIAGGVRDMFEYLSNVVVAACNAGTLGIDLLIYLCCNGKPIDEQKLDIIWTNSLMGNSSVTENILLVLKPQEERSTQMAAVMRLLPVLGQPDGQALRIALSPCLVELISTFTQEIQAKFSTQLEDSNSLRKLHVFGMGVRAAQWLHPLLNDTLRTLISRWPTPEKFSDMVTLQLDVLRLSHGGFTGLKEQLDQYCIECLIKPGTIDLATRNLVETLIRLWQERPDNDRKAVALFIAQGRGPEIRERCECLRQILSAPDAFIRTYNQIAENFLREPDTCCIDVVKLLLGQVHLSYERSACWRSVAYHWIKVRESTLLEYALTHLPVADWFQWLSDLQAVFADLILQGSETSSSLLHPSLHRWTHNIIPYEDTITRLEHDIGPGPATQCLLVGFETKQPNSIMQILRLLKEYFQNSDDGQTSRLPTQATIALLDRVNGGNALEIHRALSMLKHTTINGNDAYMRVLDVYQNTSPEVAQVLLVGWHQHPDFEDEDRWALEALGKLLGIKISNYNDSIANALGATSHYITSQVDSLLAEESDLVELRKFLKAVDPKGTSALLAELGIEDTSPLGDEIASLPTELVDVVEIVGKHDVELHFPLNHLTELQRAGMGIRSSRSLIVRLFVASPSLPSGFCLHFNDEPKDLRRSKSHSPWLAIVDSSDGGTSSCYGNVNRATFQLGFILARHLLSGPKPLEETYKFLKLRIDNMSQYCVVCGTSFGMRLRRSAICRNHNCSSTFLVQAHLNIQLHDLRADIQVADLLLTATQAAATTGNMTLLPECPVRDAVTVTEQLNSIAKQAGSSLNKVWRLNKGYVGLLKWIFGRYGGFIVSASGTMRVPSMPGVHQFLVANAAPGLEKAFAAQMGSLPTRVVFHGTSLDRLYSILCHGLQIYSGNSSLQRHGASYGRGIYVADEPVTAMGYAHPYISRGTGNGWNSNTFNNVSVLLACEALGNISTGVSSGIHVIPNPNLLILRYIFLMPPGFNGPPASHIVTAMTSVFSSLRSGSL